MVGIKLQDVPRSRRVMRRPQHTFFSRQKPWVISPFLIAPVLPGETLKQLLLQSRCVTDPIKNGLIGWWLEYYIFYVKHTDLNIRDDLKEMHLDIQKDMSSHYSATKLLTYHKGSKLDFTQMCLERVTECYFRDEGEAWNVSGGTFDSMPLAAVNKPGWYDSIMDSAAMPDTTLVNEAGSGTLTTVELEASYRTWEFLRQQNLTQATYEDYLETFGIRRPVASLNKPELIRYVREWQYPSNVVDPVTGVPSSAVSWAIAERADKDRFFTEPGFIFGVSVLRPKTYMDEQRGSAAHMLEGALSWLPAIMKDDPASSLRIIDNATGPIEGTTNDYWVDIRDIYLYGDQFINLPEGTAGYNMIALPDANLNHKYASDADLDGLFVTADTAIYARQDGVVSLQILGAQVDQT